MVNTKLKKTANLTFNTYKKQIKIVAICALVLVVLAIVISLFSNKPNPDTARDQLAAIATGDFTQAYNLTSKSFQQHTSFDNFKAFIDNSPLLKQNKVVNFISRKMEGRTEYLKGVIQGSDGSIIMINYQLVKEDGLWKVQSISLLPASNG